VVIPGQTAITIPSLVTSVSVPFTIVGDDLDEPDEEVVAALWFFEPTHAEYGDRVATCTIRDDDRANARFSILADRLARGGSTTARLILGDAAVGATTIRLSSSEGLNVPESVEIPAGATRVEFPVTGVVLGEGFVRAELPGGAAVEQRLLVYTAGALSLPPAIRVNRGGAIEVPLQLAAAEEQPFTVSITSSDAKIAAPPMFATIPGAFTLYGVANGQATLTITLPPELGGTSVLLAVEVVDPVSKRRSLR
jgi:hypothetical protein